MTTVIVFDTETTGLPSKYNAKVTELGVWPYIVQFSWIVYNIESMDMIKCEDHIIKLKDMSIPPESTKIHGITNERIFISVVICLQFSCFPPLAREPATPITGTTADCSENYKMAINLVNCTQYQTN